MGANAVVCYPDAILDPKQIRCQLLVLPFTLETNLFRLLLVVVRVVLLQLP